MSAFRFIAPGGAQESESFSAKVEQIKQLLQERRDRLIFVADFDHTLTTMRSHQCHDPVCFNPLLPSDFHLSCIKLNNTPMTDWNEWWLKCHDFIVKEANLTGELFREGLNAFDFQFREHCHELFHTLHAEAIPSFIVSAGIQNVIEEIIKLHELKDGPHIQFFTNRMIFDSNDRLECFEPPIPVTSQSKHRLPVHLPDLFSEQIPGHEQKERPKFDVAIILGDNVWDFSVLKDLPYFHSIKIGFANDGEKAQTLREKGLCDLVLVGVDHDMRPVNELLIEILSLSSIAASVTVPSKNVTSTSLSEEN